MRTLNDFGVCGECGAPLAPVWFEEPQYYPGTATKTGWVRIACSHLECTCRGKKYVVDDSFDGPWRRKNG